MSAPSRSFDKIDFQGHVKFDGLPESVLTIDEIKEKMPRLYEDIEKYESLNILLGPGVANSFHRFHGECPNCGVRLDLDLDHIQNRICTLKGAPCPHPKGILPFTLEIDVPSGVLVIGNDFRDVVPLFDAEPESASMLFNMEIGKAYEKQGMVHVFVGNSCPEIVQFANDDVKVRGYGYKTGKVLGGVCTDLWWFCAMDEADYLAQCEHYQIAPDTDLVRIKTEPGRWSFVVDYRDFDQKEFKSGYQYAKAKRIGPCQGFKRENPFELISSLEDSSMLKSFQRAEKRNKGFYSHLGDYCAHVFCVLGNGYHWTHGQLMDGRGSPTQPYFTTLSDSRIQPASQSTLDPFIPAFDGTFIFQKESIYPMSKDYNTLADAPANADIYWLTMAMIFFKSIKDHPSLFLSAHGHNPVKQQELASLTLDMLCSLVEQTHRVDEAQYALLELEASIFPALSSGQWIGQAKIMPTTLILPSNRLK